jgi:hypothetical protein
MDLQHHLSAPGEDYGHEVAKPDWHLAHIYWRWGQVLPFAFTATIRQKARPDPKSCKSREHMSMTDGTLSFYRWLKA